MTEKWEQNTSKVDKYSTQPTGFLKLLCFMRALVGGQIVVWFIGIYGLMASISVLITRSRKVGDFYMHSWARGMCAVFNIHVEVEGLENIPKEGVLFVINHTSNYDIPIFHTAILKSARFGAKIELYKIPIFSQTLRAMGALPITRGDREKVLNLYRESVPRVYAGESFILAGEGTRLPHPGVGEKFKSGPFIFAIAGQFPIVPVVIRGAGEFLPKGSLLPGMNAWRPLAKVKVLPPLYTKGLTEADRPELQERARILMTKAYSEL